DDIDIFAGGISESPLAGGMVGETFSCLMGEQFEKLRKGDRFWFENPGVFTKGRCYSLCHVTFHC
ncbi:hypothetical protein CAPTEDRAFT_128664, partial [Capitella teleta]